MRPRRQRRRKPANRNPDEELGQSEGQVLWPIGDVSDDDDDDEGEDEDIDHHQHPLHRTLPKGNVPGTASSTRGLGEQSRLVDEPL